MYKFFILLTVSMGLSAAEFKGWEGLRVMPLEGSISASDVGDVNGDGYQSLFIANRRQARIDIYNWLPPEKRKKGFVSESPNELPMAEDFERIELPLERPPYEVQLKNLDDDKELEMIVLTVLPLKLNRFDLVKGKWQKTDSWTLPKADLQAISILPYKDRVFVSTQQGVVIQQLSKGAQSEWLKPLETNVRRLDWWITDLNQDGEDDLIDLIIDSSDKAVFRISAGYKGKFLPAIPIGDVKGTYGTLDLSDNKPKLFMHNPVRPNTVNEYVFDYEEKSLFGKNRLLPRLNLKDEQATSVKVGNDSFLVEIDPDRPIMRVSKLTDEGFLEIGNFPVLRKTSSVISPAGSDFLLMRVGDSANLYKSHWEKGRFTYPKLYEAGKAEKDEMLLGMGQHAGKAWWVTSTGSEIKLHLLSSGAEKPETMQFSGLPSGLNQAFWLGGKNLMVRKKYAKNSSFYTLKGSKAEEVKASHLNDASESQFRFFKVNGEMKMARLVDGILQWYNDELQPVDQVMLEKGKKITDAAMYGKSMLVIDQSGEEMHEFSEDKSGMMKKVKTYEIPQSNSIISDEVLGLILTNNRMINAITEGKPVKLTMKHSVNEKLGLPSGVRKAFISNFRLMDISGSARHEMVLTDFSRKQLTLIDFSGESPKSLASWKVYDDGKYPYSDGSAGNPGRGQNPYFMASLDFDGDGIRELVLACHDRLLIYVGREVKK